MMEMRRDAVRTDFEFLDINDTGWSMNGRTQASCQLIANDQLVGNC